jgi:stage V sporulation protein AF
VTTTTQQYELGKDLKRNMEFFDRELGVKESFDIIKRPISVGGRDGVFYMVDGFVKDDIMLHIMRGLMNIQREEILDDNLEILFKKYIPYVEVEKQKDVSTIITFVLAGAVCFMLDGYGFAFVIDARTYPARGPEEPDIERVSRGARDGFVETVVFNTALIRRRLRDPRLRMELMQVGKRSRTDIVVCYINDITNPRLVGKIKKRLSTINIDGLPMAEKSLEELLDPKGNWNPFPKVRYTERPDVAAVHLLEGHVVIIVDGSPSVIIAPTTYFHHLQHAEEYRQNPLVGAYLRWIRFLGIFASTFLLPLYYLVSVEPGLLPDYLQFIGPEKFGKVPLLVQFLLAEIGVDLIRMAAIHTPSPLATAMGLIAAVLIGEIAINIGLFVPEVILYAALAAVGTFSTPSYEVSLANRFIRYFLLLASAVFKLPGYVGGIILLFVFLALSRSFGIPYLWPLIPFNAAALFHIILRSPVPIQKYRPAVLEPLDKKRQGRRFIPLPLRRIGQYKMKRRYDSDEDKK